ncbi:hypothetical protein [Microbulbifer sp. JMSA008]|uniref:hypothetical protein n=1 Tax=Microbulbifer sp. JMSA008 TaxID=3243373 RepID=UPI00403A058C
MKVQPTVKSHRLLKQMTPNKKSRKFINNFLIVIFLLYLSNSSLANCLGDSHLRVCNLSGWHTIHGKGKHQDIHFTFRSQKHSSATPFSLEIQPEREGFYRLYAENGEAVDIILALSAPHHRSFTFNPGTVYQDIPGSNNDANADLRVKLVRPRNFSSNSYQGNFQLLIAQTESGKTQKIDFSIALKIQPKIYIKQLDDIFLSNMGVSPGQDIVGHEDFCVGGSGFSQYSVSLSSSGGISAGAFVLTGISEHMPYIASFSDNIHRSPPSIPGASGRIPGLFNRSAPEECLSNNARITITVPSPFWERANESKYTDVLTVTVTSQ